MAVKAKKPPARQRKAYNTESTRAALLDAAAGEFAKRGFRDASLRRICTIAGTLPGSVHYHFGSKEALYRQAIVAAHQKLLAGEARPSRSESATPEEALRRWVEHALSFMILRRPGTVAGLLLSNELREPTDALTYLVEHVMKPKRAELSAIITELCGDVPRETVEQGTDMIMAIAVVYEQCQPVLKRFGRSIPRDGAAVAKLAASITHFALHGLRPVR